MKVCLCVLVNMPKVLASSFSLLESYSKFCIKIHKFSPICCCFLTERNVFKAKSRNLSGKMYSFLRIFIQKFEKLSRSEKEDAKTFGILTRTQKRTFIPIFSIKAFRQWAQIIESSSSSLELNFSKFMYQCSPKRL